jgi:hypothetical protein
MNLSWQLRPRSCTFPIVLALSVSFAIPGCQNGKVSRKRIELKDQPGDKPVVAQTKPALVAPICPSAGVPSLQVGAPGSGHHKVTLTWNASAHSSNSDSDAYGYCLYRTQGKGLTQIKQTANCNLCEQVNQVPVLSTGCIDDLVADDTKYDYVVAAVNSKSVLSAPSNEILVSIPSAQSVKASRPSTLPLCRAGSKPQAR